LRDVHRHSKMDSRKLDVVEFNALPSISKHRTGRIANERRRSHVRIYRRPADKLPRHKLTDKFNLPMKN